MNGRLGLLSRFGDPPGYQFDTAEYRAGFMGYFREAKAIVPSSAPTKSILSIPRASRTIQFGRWYISPVEIGTMLVTNRYDIDEKLIIKEDLTSFMYECNGHRKLFTADSILDL